MLYSSEMKLWSGTLSEEIQKCLIQVKEYFGLSELKVLQYNENSIAIPLIFPVQLPIRNTVNGIDIREKESMLLQISVKQYPYVMPMVRSDRKDFPTKLLPHLYGREPNEATALCLVRNNPNEWFANKTITDLLTVASEWLFKAACGKLADDGDEWDPKRIAPNGQHIYSYDYFHEMVITRNCIMPDWSCSFVFGYAYMETDKYLYRSLRVIPLMGLEDVLKSIKRESQEKTLEVLPMFSILAWDKNDTIDCEYNVEYPRTYATLKALVKSCGIDLDKIIYGYVNLGCNLINGIPFILAVKRPKKMVGYDGVYEFFNFRINGKDIKNKRIPNNADVTMQTHIEPFSKAIANKLTGEDRNTKRLFVGAGSLGSKMIVHEARSGNINIGVVDNDHLLEHNLARHALFNNNIGDNKAVAIVKEIKGFYKNETTNFESYNNRLHNVFDEVKGKYDALVDSTAGRDSLNFLSISAVPSTMLISKVEIADDGQIGLLYVEGKNRNPRIDDLVNLTFFEALKNPILETWRRNDANKEVTNLSVGLGCSSTTVIMPDDIISYHASIFSKVLYNINDRRNIDDKGILFRSILKNDGLPVVSSESLFVEPFEEYSCLADSGWSIRMQAGVTQKLLFLCNKYSPIETGGILIGIGNYKTRTIHVFDIIEEPQDSKGTCIGFTRGIKGLPKQVDEIKEKTGNVIGYIGEWHTHPMNLQCLSTTDHETIAELIKINRKEPIPTCAIIVTKEKILPFVYE